MALSSSIFQPFKTSKSLNPFFFPTPTKTLTLTCTSQPNPKPKPNKKTTMNGHKPNSKSKGPRKPSYGASRRSVLKKTFVQEQVTFNTRVSDDPVVAIIGGGMSGLLCAPSLEKRGVRSMVFDTGVHGLGERMRTRIIDPQPLIFDHAAQFFTVSDPRFAELVNGWLEKGLVQQWEGTIGEHEVGGGFVPLPSSY